MKRILLTYFVSLSVVLNLYTQQYWITVPSPVNKSLNKCFLLDTIYGWAAGDSGVIVRTTNGGANWTAQSSGITSFPIDDIFFINQNTGWALSNDYLFQGTIVLRTSNGGTNWTNYRLTDTTKVFNVIYFLNSLTGFMSGYTGEIFKTTNGGTNWIESRIDTAYCSFLYLFPKNRFSFLNANTGYVCGGQIDIQGIIWKTTDSGLNWFTYCIAPEPLYDIKVINQSKIVATGGDYEYGISFVVSHNSGNSWFYRETGLQGTGRSLAYRTASELWVPGGFSTNFGLNLDSGSLGSMWYQIPAPNSIAVNAAQFVTPNYGWAFGSGGAILKYNNSVIGIVGNQNQTPGKSSLFQNYPNPFNPTTNIYYSLAAGGNINLSIYNILGELVDEPVKGFREKGDHTVTWDGSSFPSGIYFYKMTTDNHSETRKMLLMK